MKQGRFITHPDYIAKDYPNPWGKKQFNCYDWDPQPGPGILTVKKEFSADPEKRVEKVTVRATSLGIFDLFVNGLRVKGRPGNPYADEYKPGWTDYRFRVFEFEYDITKLCSFRGVTSEPDSNLLVAEVSPGWWSGRISFGFYGFKPTAFCGEIEISYTDGSSELLPSSGDWETSICGPVMSADIWDGEYYDATVPEPSSLPSAHAWKKPVLYDGFEGEILPAEGPAIRSCPELARSPQSAVRHSGTVGNGSEYGAIKVLEKKAGPGCETGTLRKGEALILDFGQNMVGRPVIALNAKRGTKITLFFAEMLNDSGDPARGNDGPKDSLYITNYRSAAARAIYIASGTEEIEVYHPTHSFFGFRYVEIRTDGETEIHEVRGDVIRSATVETGSFCCDNPEVNRLYENILWGMRGNYLSIPTDCPQRDERLGWTGDTQIFSGAASYLADIDGFMRKWLKDAEMSQRGFGGAYCDVIPRVFKGNNGNAAWGDAGLIVPYRLWLMYRDAETVAVQYPSMERYMEYLEQYGLEGPNTAYGDWLNYDVTDKRYIAVCCYALDASLMEKFSRILGKEDRAMHYAELREKIAAHWRERYVGEDGLLTVSTQTGYLLALGFGLAEGGEKERFAAELEKKITDNGFTLSTGFVGTGILNQTLSSAGLDKLAYSLLLQTRDPSWLYSVRQGATTVWERWNSYTKEKGFGDVGMNSFNHYAYGAVAEWLFSGVCGIAPDPEKPGFEHFILKPTPDFRRPEEIPEGQKAIGMASATYAARPCPAGERIQSSWERFNGRTLYRFFIPEGMSASVSLVAGGELRLNGLLMTAGDLGAEIRGGRIEFGLRSGRYTVEIAD